MIRILRYYFVSLGFIALITSSAYCSQIANHVRVAYEAMEHPETAAVIRDVLQRNLEAYKAGAAGPDVLTNLVGQYSGLAHKAHYEKTGELVKAMLQTAARQSDPVLREKYFAYALGWMTHNYLDVYEHAVVNQYGGYYAVSHERHKDLEMFESSHVLGTSHDPMKAFVSRRSGLQENLITDAFYKTYWPTFKVPFAAGDLHNAAIVIENFTANAAKEFQTQKLQSRLSSGYELAVGRVPFTPAYYHIVDPVFLGIRSITPPGQGKSEIQAQLDYLLMDNSLKVSYITDWYDANRKALTAIEGRFRAIASSVSIRDGVFTIDPAIDPAVPDYNLDTGRLESVGDADAISISSKFKPVEEMELRWEIYEGQQKLTEGSEPIFITQPGKAGNFTLSIPAGPQFFSGTGKKQLTLKVVLSAINSNPHLMKGKYATAFRFQVDDTNNRVRLKSQERLPIQNSDEKSFWTSSAGLAKKEPGEEIPSGSQTSASLDELRELAARASAMRTDAKELLASLTQKRAEMESITQNFQVKKTAYETARSQWEEASRMLSQESQKLSALAAQSETAAQQAIQAKQLTENSTLEACEKALLIKNSTSQAERNRLLPEVISAAGRASSQARNSQEQSIQSRKALESIRKILAQAGELKALPAKYSSYRNELQALGRQLQLLLSDGESAVQRLEAIVAEMQPIAAQASGLRQQILNQLKPFSTDQSIAMKNETEQLYGTINAAVTETAGAAAEARALLASIQQIGSAIIAAINALQPLSSISGAEGGDTLARADSAASVAETFSGQAADAAAKAEACANASRGRVPGSTAETKSIINWDQAASSAESSTDTSANWDEAAAESTSSTASETPQLAQAPVPDVDYPELDDPAVGYPENEYPENEYPENEYPETGDTDTDYEEEKNRNMEDLAQGLIDLMNTINKQGNNTGIQNQPNTGQRQSRQQQSNQEGPGCAIMADTRQFPDVPFHVRQKIVSGVTMIFVNPAPTNDPKAQMFLEQQYGRLISTHNNSKAAVDAARRICPNPIRESIN